MEDDIFIKKMKGVKLLKNKNNYIESANIKKNKKILKTPTKTNQKDETIETKKTKQSIYKITFGEINKDLKKGRIKIDKKLDLHGYNLLDAEVKFKTEVISAYNKNKRCLLVITGKGVHINNENDEDKDFKKKPKLFYGKIKNSITSWVNEDEIKNYILTYQNAGIEYGGDGAIFIYLRRKKN
jgi:DNA-nicking Smr family endonuclease